MNKSVNFGGSILFIHVQAIVKMVSKTNGKLPKDYNKYN